MEDILHPHKENKKLRGKKGKGGTKDKDNAVLCSSDSEQTL